MIGGEGVWPIDICICLLFIFAPNTVGSPIGLSEGGAIVKCIGVIPLGLFGIPAKPFGIVIPPLAYAVEFKLAMFDMVAAKSYVLGKEQYKL